MEGKGWTPAGDLQAGDKIRKADESSGKVEKIKIEQTTHEMYNLTVDQAHTFYVGDGQWLVHNSCGTKEELIAESILYDKKAPTYHNNRINPFEIFKNLSNGDYWPNPDFPGGFLSRIGGYRPTSTSGFATIDFAGGVKIKFPFASK